MDIKRFPPKNLYSSDRILFEHEFEKHIPNPEIVNISWGVVFWGGQIFKNFRVIKESLLVPNFSVYYSWKFLLKGFFQKKIRFLNLWICIFLP